MDTRKKILLIIGLLPITLFSQEKQAIKTITIGKKKENKVVTTRCDYDSLLNIKNYASYKAYFKTYNKEKEKTDNIYFTIGRVKMPCDSVYYQQFIGQELFFYIRNTENNKDIPYCNFESITPTNLPNDTIWYKKRKRVRPKDYKVIHNKTKKYKPSFYKDKKIQACGIDAYNVDANSYYKRSGYFTSSKNIEGKTFKILDVKIFRYKNIYAGIHYKTLKFKLLSQEKDTLNWYVHYDEKDIFGIDKKYALPVVIKGFIDKLKIKYIGREFFYTDNNFYHKKELVAYKENGEKIKIKIDSKLKCLDVIYAGKEDEYLVPSFVFEDENKQKIIIPISRYPRNFDYKVKDIYNSFSLNWAFLDELVLTPAEVIFAEKEMKKKADEKRKIEEKKQFALRRKKLIKKYGNYNADLILQGKVQIGMTKKMCIEAWGEPDDINKTSGSWGVHEQWIYNLSSFLYFENGVLRSI